MIETALYSFWSKPYIEKNSFKTFAQFNNEFDFMLSWSTSVNLSKKNFKKVVLVTDTWAWENIFKELELPFDNIILSLDDINHSTDHWSISKAYAILEVKDSFIHIDSDVYMWEKLSDKILCKDVLVQDGEGIYNKDQYMMYLGLEWDYQKYLKGKNIYLDNSNLFKRKIYAWNCGIVGGTNVEFLHKWASEMIKVTTLYDTLQFKNQYKNPYIPVWTEQTLLMLMSELENIEVTPLLSNRDELQNTYTHLMGDSKRNVSIMDRLNKKHNQLFGKLNYINKNKPKKLFDISKLCNIFKKLTYKSNQK